MLHEQICINGDIYECLSKIAHYDDECRCYTVKAFRPDETPEDGFVTCFLLIWYVDKTDNSVMVHSLPEPNAIDSFSSYDICFGMVL